jgi:anti-sigma-K factor RskA
MSTDLHTFSGAYAIDALSHEEAEAFENHLKECSACRDEVREFQEAAATMGASEATPPPAQLRARVLAAVDKAPQLPPKVSAIGAARSRRWMPRLLTAAAALALVVGASVVVHNQTSNNQPALAASVAAVFHESDAHRSTVDTANGGKLTVATSKKLGEMAVDTTGLKRLSSAQVYQMWAIAGGKRVSVGVLADIRSGKEMKLPAAGTKVAITIEPAGGSIAPTTTPIVTVDPDQV